MLKILIIGYYYNYYTLSSNTSFTIAEVISKSRVNSHQTVKFKFRVNNINYEGLEYISIGDELSEGAGSKYLLMYDRTRPKNNILLIHKGLQSYQLGDHLDSIYSVDDIEYWVWFQN